MTTRPRDGSPMVQLAVDACVAKEASNSKVPRSTTARDALESVRKSKSIVVVFSPLLTEEWSRHAARFSVLWKSTMVSRRRVRFVADKPSRLLRAKVRDCLADPADVAALLKDVYLLELGLVQGSRILSSDRRTGRLAAEVAIEFSPLGRVQWIDPHSRKYNCLAWLVAGCVDDDIGRLT